MKGAAAFNGHHVEDLFWGSPDELRELLDGRWLGRYDEVEGGFQLGSPVRPGQGHKVEARLTHADHLDFSCDHGCTDEAIRARLQRVHALASPAEELEGKAEEVADSSWAPVDLIPVIENGATEEPPTMVPRDDGPCLLYPARNHALFAEPEAGKGWFGLHAAKERLTAGEHVAYFDFEDTAATVVGRLLALGLGPQAITQRFHYVRPDEALDAAGQAALDGLLSMRPTLAIIDGVTEALTLHGLELKDNADVARWLKLLPRRLTDAGAAVIQIDHVSKDRDARGRFAIGTEHKLAGVDVAYALEVLEPFGRDARGGCGSS